MHGSGEPVRAGAYDCNVRSLCGAGPWPAPGHRLILGSGRRETSGKSPVRGARPVTTTPARIERETAQRPVPAPPENRRRSGVSQAAPLVLCYHAVSSSWDNELSVSLATLRHQVRRLLGAGFRPTDAAGAVRGNGRMLHVTFDDAFTSVLGALPVLKELGVPATVFACSSLADGGAPLSVPELAEEVAQHPAELATLEWNELRRIAEDGVEVGSHTVSHPRLSTLSDSALEYELVESKRRFEDELGRPCRFVSYPYGDQDRRVRDAARRAGYEAAFALPVGSRWGDPYQIGRVGLWRSDRPVKVYVKTSGLFRTELGRRLVHARRPTSAGQASSAPSGSSCV